ncbi:hypothetical protein MACH26_22050 [Planctobacterium marinum]|uniref:DUF2066 domain-containing protein n=1 Tax=Planctobacterium marinum TaxID=1631968 RepID=A0AA48HK24_9ALTE|nr:hypothetical protein MACH26_22050 [Planctobacterium marinum]
MVASQTVAAQNDAIRNSFNQVLIKVSGSQETVTTPEIIAMRNSARDLIQSFRFESTADGSFMIASFDEDKINQLLTQSGRPVWGKRRPDTLMWMAYLEEDGDRAIVSATSVGPVKQKIDAMADSRGIPISFPLMDIEDAELVHVFDVWGRFDTVIKQASQRYPNDNLVSARIYDRRKMSLAEQEVPLQMAWQLDWQLLNNDLIEEGTWFAASETEVLQKFVDMIADRLAEQYAVEATGELTQTNVEMKIINLDSLESYVTVTRFLSSLAMVNSVKLLEISGQVARFRLELIGQQSDLLNTLQLDAKITQKTDAFGRVTDDMEFLWLQ